MLSPLSWLSFLAVTIVLLVALVRQDVDPLNRALKTPGSVDAANLQRLAAIVPDDPVMLLAFGMRGDMQWLGSDLERIEALRDELAALPGVTTCELAPVADPTLRLMTIALRDDEPLTLAERIVARARTHTSPSVHVLATGRPLVEGTIARLVAGERRTVVPRLLAVLLLAAFVFYRHLGLALATLLPAITAIVWTGGAVAWLGHRLDPVAALLDPVLLTIGVAASVHFVEAYRHARSTGDVPVTAVATAARALHTPALLATATTMAGAWCLASSETPAVAEFGVRAALGVALAHLLTFLLLSAWLPLAAGSVTAIAAPRRAIPWVPWLARNRMAVTVVVTAATTLAVAGLAQLCADNDPLRLLPASEQLRIDHEKLSERLGGVEICHLLVPARSPASEPSRLLPMLAGVRTLPGIAGIAGPALYGRSGALAVPLLLAPAGSASRVRLFDEIDRTTNALGLDGVQPAGQAVQIARDSHRLLQGMRSSFFLSGAVLILVMALGLRSLRLSLLAMLPSLLPSLWLYGSLGLLARPVSVATAMIGSTMLGLVVDNSLHLLHAYRTAARDGSPRRAVQRALASTGRAITLSSGVLLIGFATAATSRLETTVEFAWLATLTIGGAWVASVMVLPLLLLARTRYAGVRDAL